MSLSTGTRLGPYEILGLLGAGGMGQVYKARDTRLDRPVAVKSLNGPHTERFEREAQAIAALNHPHICTLYDVGPDYLVMEYLEGRPLKGPLPLDEALRLAIQIAEALNAAHRKGIIHRDLKPGNILLTKSGIKLLDFGLAKLSSPSIGDGQATCTIALTEKGTVLGTYCPYRKIHPTVKSASFSKVTRGTPENNQPPYNEAGGRIPAEPLITATLLRV
jgi:serine/threonine protein kinase